MYVSNFQENSIYNLFAEYEHYVRETKAEGKEPVSVLRFVMGNF